jgi:hypothetical protein|tara:strand:+ start:1070 stop:1240 length:171 start_codon:yes stop_codon:yes gene_type:complete
MDKKKTQLLYLNKKICDSLNQLAKRYDLSMSRVAEIILRDGIENIKKNGVGKLKID